MTFSGIARNAADDTAKARRNTENERKAYDAVIRFLPRCALTPDEADEMRGKMAALETSLIDLGETL